jgi:Spy/CpxP family protein refolding chaperone
MKRIQYVLLASLMLSFCASAWAVQLNLPPGKWWENPRLVEQLQLTEEQQGAIREVVFEHARRMIDLGAAVRKSELELEELVGGTDFDTAGVREAFGSFQVARQALESERFELLLAVREQLTLEQWKTVQGMRQDVMRRRGQQDRPMLQGERQSPRRRPPVGGF